MWEPRVTREQTGWGTFLLWPDTYTQLVEYIIMNQTCLRWQDLIVKSEVFRFESCLRQSSTHHRRSIWTSLHFVRKLRICHLFSSIPFQDSFHVTDFWSIQVIQTRYLYLISYMTVQLSVSKVVNQEKPVTWSLLPLVRLLTISCLAYFPQKTASHFFRVSSFDWRLICSILTPNIGHLPRPLKF